MWESEEGTDRETVRRIIDVLQNWSRFRFKATRLFQLHARNMETQREADAAAAEDGSREDEDEEMQILISWVLRPQVRHAISTPLSQVS